MSLYLEKLINVDPPHHKRILRLLHLIKLMNDAILRNENIEDELSVKQYYHLRKKYVDELEEILKIYNIQLNYQKTS